MGYTIKRLAELAGVSVRTLHHYDQIGLLRPVRQSKNQYRQYGEHELLRLQQILFFRELEFPLEDIKQMMSQSNFDIVGALRDQKKLVELKRSRLDGLLTSINKTIRTMTNDEKMKDEELYDALKDDDVKQYQAEVKERWGNTDAYKQSQTRVSKMTKKEMDKLKADGKIFTQKLADSMDKDVSSSEVQELVKQHHAGIKFFYACPTEMYRKLGQMYVDDPRFTAYYDKFRPGLAVWLRDAIQVYCDRSDH